MLENDETSADCRGIAQDLFPVGKDLANCCSATVDVEVISVEGCHRANASPQDRSQTHGGTDSADAVINIAIGRPHCVGRNAEDIMDNLLRPT